MKITIDHFIIMLFLCQECMTDSLFVCGVFEGIDYHGRGWFGGVFLLMPELGEGVDVEVVEFGGVVGGQVA